MSDSSSCCCGVFFVGFTQEFRYFLSASYLVYCLAAGLTACVPAGAAAAALPGPALGADGTSGYSKVTPASHSKTGQQPGKSAVLLVFSDNLHFGLGLGSGPQSSTNSQSRPC